MVKILIISCVMLLAIAPVLAVAQEHHTRLPKQVVQHAWGDIHDSFWGVPLLFFASGAGVTAGLAGMDDTIKEKVTGHNYLGKWNTISNYAGAAYTVDSAAALTYVGGLISKSEEWRRAGEVLVESLIIAEGVTAGLKYTVNRQRPNGGNYSFPSGHAARTFCAASALTTMYGWWGVPAFVAAGAISASRITSDSHYFTDVLFGAVLGSTIGYGTAHFHKKGKPLLFTVLPMATAAGGGGIQVAGSW